MTGVMSLWTGTPMFRPNRNLLLIHTLACCLAGEAFGVTEFISDSHGIEIADRLRWKYTSYVNAFDSLCDQGMTHVWALGKLTALTLQTGPFCHLDNDVLLHRRLPVRILESRLFAQGKDVPSYYTGVDMEAAIARSGLGKGAVPYNVGIVGGRAVDLIHEYAHHAVEIARRFNGLEGSINGTTTSMVVEQYFLGKFSRDRRVRVEELIPIATHCTPEDIEKAQYTHLVGSCKHDAEWVGKCEARLKAQFPSSYDDFVSGWKHLAGTFS